MSKLNEMRMYTWNSQGLNYVVSDKGQSKFVPYYTSGDSEPLEAVEAAFAGRNYGLSEKIKKENQEFRNYSIYRDITEDRDTEYIELRVGGENNILVAGIDINAGKDTTSSFLIHITGEASQKLYDNIQLRVNIEDKARVKLVVVTDLPEETTNFLSVTTILGEESYLDQSYIEVGGDYSVVNLTNIMEGDNSILIEDGVYFKEKDQFLDLLANNEHYGNATDSDAMFNGAVKDRAHKNWKGVVDLRKGCFEADGKIGDYSMMFSNEVKNKTAPILLCAEKEVAGNHAASVGRLNKEMLFYIMSRGFDKKQAESMMLEAVFSKAIDKIDKEDLRASLKEKVHQMNIRD